MTEIVEIGEPNSGAIVGAPTSVALFVGRTVQGPAGVAMPIAGMTDFTAQFGLAISDLPLTVAVRDFYANGGGAAVVCRLVSSSDPYGPLSEADWLAGVAALPERPAFNIACLVPDQPGVDVPETVVSAVTALCAQRKAMAILTPPRAWLAAWQAGQLENALVDIYPDLALNARRAAAVYFPDVVVPDPQTSIPITVSAAGAAAGAWAANDAARGVWTSPAGLQVGLVGVIQPQVALSDTDNGQLNAVGVDAVRHFRNAGTVLWGARTLAGVTNLPDDYGYIAVRRLAFYIEASLQSGLVWTVFEPDGPQLWASISLAASNFMDGLWRAGALMGDRPSSAYAVICDATTNTPNDIAQGVVNLIVQFAPIRPAEFVVLSLQFMTAGPA